MSDLIYQFSQQAHPGRLTALGAGINQLVTKKRQQREEEARREEYKRLYGQAMETGAAEDWTNLIMFSNPEELAKTQAAYGTMDKFQRESALKEGAQLNAALRNDPQGMGAKIIQRKIEAFEAEGDMDSADDYREMLAQVESGDPDALKAVQGYNMALFSGIPGSEAVTGQMRAQTEELRAEVAQEADLLQQGYKMDNVSDEARQRLMQRADEAGYSKDTVEKVFALANSFGGLEGMSPKDIVDAYLPIEKEYNDLALPYEETLSNAKAIKDSAFLDTGAADQAMVALFNKVLDPESVVRQSEVDATLNAAGTLSQVRTIYDRFLKGDILDAPSRARLVEAVELIANNSKDRLINIQEDLGQLIDEAGLKRSVIFKTAGTTEEVGLDRARMLIKAKWSSDDPDYDFDNASLADLKRDYPRTYAEISGGASPAEAQTTYTPPEGFSEEAEEL